MRLNRNPHLTCYTISCNDRISVAGIRFKFLGVSGSGADLSVLVAVANASVQSVRQGEHLEDFVVKEINSGQLVLELNEDTVVLKR